jgi:ketosteroid isomerase-like protein
MRAFHTLVLLVAGLCVHLTAAAQSVLPPTDENAVRQSVLALIDATNNDPMATLTEYARNERVTSVNSETIVTGWEGLVAQTRAATAGSFSMQAGKLDIVGLGPDHALVVAPFTMYWRTNSGVVTAPGSMTLAYERTAEGWKIIHEHYSEGLDDATRQRLAQAASGNTRVSGGDLFRLLLAGMGGGYSALANELLGLLGGNSCP